MRIDKMKDVKKMTTREDMRQGQKRNEETR